MKQKRRIQRLSEEIREAQIEGGVSEQPDAALFVVDRLGVEEPNNKRARTSSRRTTVEEDDSDAERHLSKDEEKHVKRLKKRMALEESATTTTTTSSSRRNLRDFWATGEAGLPPLPPLGRAQLKGVDPATINEWNVNAVAFTSERKARAVHAKRPLERLTIPAVIPGTSYNPSALDHVVALSRLGKSVMNITKAKEEREREEELRKEIARRAVVENDDDQDDDDTPEDESDDEEEREAVRKVKATPFKTKKERRHQIRAAKQQAAIARRKRENLRRDDVQGARKIATQLDAEEKAREERAKERAERKKAAEGRLVTDPSQVPPPRINGRHRRLHTIMTSNRDVIPPEQLPERMSAIPTMAGSAALDAYSHILSRNLAEVGDPNKRLGAKKKAWTKSRGAGKFDLDSAKANVAEPRFAQPKWAKGAV